MSELSFSYYMQIDSPETERMFRDGMNAAGYFAFYAFAEQFRECLRQYGDEDRSRFGKLLRRGRELFPDPMRFSPSFREIWDEYDRILAAKNEALDAVPPADRAGEWQVLIDNPYHTGQVVCYPGLPFLEASYLYGYFQRELKPNEVLRLQRVTNSLVASGNAEQSFFPSS
ncbi:hypothetical protein [Cohnella sp. GCM10027633]|uniref:hypothetical protein n=1 Tax=unclassified Cohnella TaxID=2636738 RepID=UPI0036438D73